MSDMLARLIALVAMQSGGADLAGLIDGSIKTITIPDGVRSIRPYAFHACSVLANVIIPDSVTLIGQGAFSECISLPNVIIPNSVIGIMPKAFAYCKALTAIAIPNNVNYIGKDAFLFCTGLETITINRAEGSIEGAPWGAPQTTQIIWAG